MDTDEEDEEHDERDLSEMSGVREYAEGYPVDLLQIETEYRPGCRDEDGRFQPGRDVPIPDGPRWVLAAQNEGGHNGTSVDLIDAIRWLITHRPDLLLASGWVVTPVAPLAGIGAVHAQIPCGADASHEFVIERLPYRSVPGFDCRDDHASCPACLTHGEGDHGRSGGYGYFAVRARLPDGRVAAVELEVFLHQYPSRGRREAPRRAEGSFLTFHVESDQADPRGISCAIVGPGGRCDDRSSRGEATATGAGDLYRAHGSESGGAEQGEAFWSALGDWLVVLAMGVLPRDAEATEALRSLGLCGRVVGGPGVAWLACVHPRHHDDGEHEPIGRSIEAT